MLDNALVSAVRHVAGLVVSVADDLLRDVIKAMFRAVWSGSVLAKCAVALVAYLAIRFGLDTLGVGSAADLAGAFALLILALGFYSVLLRGSSG